MDTPKQFNIRVYGLLINDQQEVLITDEYRIGMLMTKFPGVGLEFGEGTIDCLKREFMEELGLPIEVESHFYTTDYFQAAISFEKTQLMSIYYRIKTNTTEPIQTSHHSNDIPAVDGAQSFRWMPIRHLNSEEFTFLIDKIVAEMLKSDCIRAL